jgi:hypothetical protein
VLLHDGARLVERRAAAAGGLAPLAASLAADLEPLLSGQPFIPTEKARLSRAGGRCPRDGTMLGFDPWSPRLHACPSCGARYDDEAHYRWWVMGYQLWLAERAAHAALLHAVGGGDARHARLADDLLARYAALYLEYPNSDNVLGPTRLFFSTYLESIWLLQLCVALSLRESCDIDQELAARVRERVIAPSAALIASYDEGDSNRQVWNNAALFAAARLLGDERAGARALFGPSGLAAHLSRALLADGTWYEGENYHLFAHRGLWYGVTMAGIADIPLPAELVARFDEGFAAPFLSALPDLTFPSRRDSQYRVSLRQWRFAELCELGLARTDDVRLRGALHELYAADVPRGDTGRARSTAEAERNTPGTLLLRADLGWRSLLHARERLPALEPVPPRSALLPAQGLGVFRRDGGRLYAALDYGHSGGGHGHPDRLNVILADGRARWLDDVGTGSYVDPSLHWYRSTLAHNAPLVNGRSQARVHGTLRAYEERGGAGWVEAEVAGVASGTHLVRTLVVMPDYVVDELRWRVPAGAVIDLPLHAPGELYGAGAWSAAPLVGGDAPDDGFVFLTDPQVARPLGGGALRLDVPDDAGEAGAAAWLLPPAGAELWRADGPGAPGEGRRRFHLLRSGEAQGSTTTVWSRPGVLVNVERGDSRLRVELADGTVHEHVRVEQGWHVDLWARGARSSIDLTAADATRLTPSRRDPLTAGGSAAALGAPPREQDRPIRAAEHHRFVAPLTEGAPAPLTFSLGADHYRRSELPWSEAGAPTADVTVRIAGAALLVDVAVRKSVPPTFAPARTESELDNEHPDTNSDGVQLYLALPDGGGWRHSAWLIVPERDAPPRVRATPIGAAAGPPLDAAWRTTPGGYAISCTVPMERADSTPYPFYLDVIVNEISPDRERRRGQLVLSGGRGEFIYLRGDRHPADRLLPFVVDG